MNNAIGTSSFSAVTLANRAADEVALSDYSYLTPDALMSFCEHRLQGLDDQIKSRMAVQNQNITASNALGDLDSTLSDLYTDGTSIDDQGKKDRAVQALDTAIRLSVGTDAEAPLKALQEKVKNSNPAMTGAAFKDTVSSIGKSINSGSELNMIGLQSLMSQRQTAVQLTTNLLQSLGDQLNKIASNVGH